MKAYYIYIPFVDDDDFGAEVYEIIGNFTSNMPPWFEPNKSFIDFFHLTGDTDTGVHPDHIAFSENEIEIKLKNYELNLQLRLFPKYMKERIVSRLKKPWRLIKMTEWENKKSRWL